MWLDKRSELLSVHTFLSGCTFCSRAAHSKRFFSNARFLLDITWSPLSSFCVGQKQSFYDMVSRTSREWSSFTKVICIASVRFWLQSVSDAKSIDSYNYISQQKQYSKPDIVFCWKCLYNHSSLVIILIEVPSSHGEKSYGGSRRLLLFQSFSGSLWKIF